MQPRWKLGRRRAGAAARAAAGERLLGLTVKRRLLPRCCCFVNVMIRLFCWRSPRDKQDRRWKEENFHKGTTETKQKKKEEDHLPGPPPVVVVGGGGGGDGSKPPPRREKGPEIPSMAGRDDDVDDERDENWKENDVPPHLRHLHLPGRPRDKGKANVGESEADDDDDLPHPRYHHRRRW